MDRSTVYIVSAARTPIGAYLGGLSGVNAPSLGSTVIKALLQRSGLSEVGAIAEGYWGCVLSAGIGQAPARQAQRWAGLPDSTGATTVNKVCGSGMKAIMLAGAQIALGQAELVLAGGFESMSNVPYYLPQVRQKAFRMGNQALIDGMIHDGLWDPYQQLHMGSLAERCASKYSFTREAQDAYATRSVARALTAIESGTFKQEIVPVEVPPERKGQPSALVDTDEQPFKAKPDKLASLKPAFETENGSITAGNASSLNDGAAGVLLASGDALKRYGLTPLAKITGWASHSQAPEWYTTAPVGAMQKVLAQTGLTVQDIDWFELNEAFAVVAMAAIQELDLPEDSVNPHGGAIALGHPIGASGARIVVSMLHGLQARGKQRGLATLCIGGGEATALMIERV